MNAVQIRVALQRIYKKECETCMLKGNDNPCGLDLFYKINGKGFAEHEIRNEKCDAYEKEKIRE